MIIINYYHELISCMCCHVLTSCISMISFHFHVFMGSVTSSRLDLLETFFSILAAVFSAPFTFFSFFAFLPIAAVSQRYKPEVLFSAKSVSDGHPNKPACTYNGICFRDETGSTHNAKTKQRPLLCHTDIVSSDTSEGDHSSCWLYKRSLCDQLRETNSGHKTQKALKDKIEFN